jgi:hypothetical protein
MREDFRYQEYIYKTYGLKMLMEYQKLPYIEIDYNNLPKLLNPGSEFFYPFDRGLIMINNNKYWYLITWCVTDIDVFIEYFKNCIKTNPHKKDLIENEKKLITYSVIAMKDNDNDNDIKLNDHNIFCLTGLNSRISCAGKFVQNSKGERFITTIGDDYEIKKFYKSIMALFAIIGNYFYETNMKMVEKREDFSTSSVVRRMCKNVNKKPWLRDDLPSIILIDPNDTKSYGRKESQGGTHASPRPHQRRGHFRRLRSDKYKLKKDTVVKVRSCWVGDPEWVHNGSIYKVVDDDKLQTMQTVQTVQNEKVLSFK